MSSTLALFVFFGAGCRSSPHAASSPAPELRMTGGHEVPKRPAPPTTMIDGPAILPAAPLLDWLRAQAVGPTGRRRFQLPLLIRLGPSGGVDQAYVARTETELAAAPLGLTLDDSALGISLHDRLRSRCPDPASGCAVVVEGYWGPLIGVGAVPVGAPWPFAVLRVLDAAELPGFARGEP